MDGLLFGQSFAVQYRCVKTHYRICVILVALNIKLGNVSSLDTLVYLAAPSSDLFLFMGNLCCLDN